MWATARARASQFWDKGHLLSRAIVRTIAANPNWLKPGDRELSQVDPIVWDFVAVFPSGERWDNLLPRPAFYGYPAVDAIEGLAKHLDDVSQRF